MVIIQTIVSVILVSLVSLMGVFSIMLSSKKLDRLLLSLVSVSAGTLLGGAFLHLLPEVSEHQGFTVQVSLLVLLGVLVFFLLEKFIHHDRCNPSDKDCCGIRHHDTPHHIGMMNLFGDGLHNFIDGLVIAGSYLVSIPVGIAATVAVIFHEVPQELADFGVLLYAGFSKWKALFYNFLSAAAAIIGAIIGLALGSSSEYFIQLIIPFAAGGFIYIAGVNLIPELHKECGIKESILHFSCFVSGMALMYILRILG